MSGPKRNPDKLNTLGVVVIGICSAVLVYVTIVALQAFYMKDTSEIQTMADYGGNDTNFRTVKSAAMNNITEYGKNPDGSFRIGIDVAIKKVAEEARTKPSNLVPGTPSVTPSAQPIFGRSKPLEPAAGSGSAAGSADAGSAAGSAAGSGSAAASATGSAAPMVPTGGQAQGGGPGPTTGAANPGTNNAPAAGSVTTPKASSPGASAPGGGSGAGSGSAAKGNAP
jgi:hypothetical protein